MSSLMEFSIFVLALCARMLMVKALSKCSMRCVFSRISRLVGFVGPEMVFSVLLRL